MLPNQIANYLKSQAIEHSRGDFIVSVDGDAARIDFWDTDKLGPQPDTATLDQFPAEIAPTLADVKEEAGRRITAIMPEHKQRNALAEMLDSIGKHGADLAQWPDAERIIAATHQAAWDEIKRLRERSDALERMDPVPDDFTDDRHWIAT